jgi:hypothetical protein
MKPFKTFLNENIPKKFVFNKVHITFHDDRADFHHGANLIHSKSGDYKNPTFAQYIGAKSKATDLWHTHIKNRFDK